MNHEEELQRSIEELDLKLTEKDEINAKAYQEVFKVLNTMPQYVLPPDFADRIVGKVTEQDSKLFSKDHLWLVGGILVLVISCVVTVVFAKVEFDLGFLKSMAGYKGILLFGAAFIIILNLVDKLLIRNKRQALV